ncbi:MAG: mechanosensitive ion channel domain-containing protein [Phycisphaeraceae bacterium]
MTHLQSNAVETLVLLAVLVLLRFVAVRAIRGWQIKSADLRRRWLVQLRNGTVIIALLGLLVIWASELQTLAFGFVAFAAALVLATRELLLCFSGSLLKVGAGSFVVGDRIEIRGLRGEVVDQTLLATTIEEVGPGKLTHQRTGRMIVLPNSLFLTEPLVNESFNSEYVLHVFTVPLKMSDDEWAASSDELLAAARKHCSPFLEAARRYREQQDHETGRYTASMEPRVTVQLSTIEELTLVVRVPVPTASRSRIEQAIIRDYLEARQHRRATAPPAPSAATPATSPT